MAQERSWAFGLFFPLQPWTFLGVFWEGGGRQSDAGELFLTQCPCVEQSCPLSPCPLLSFTGWDSGTAATSPCVSGCILSMITGDAVTGDQLHCC